MSEDWMPIERSKVRVLGVDDHAPGLLDVRISLDRDPPEEWTRMFEHPTGVSMSLSMHPPRLASDEVHIRPPDDELERYVMHVDERIAHANASYEADVLPRLRAARARERAAEDERDKRVADAQSRAQEL